MKYFTYLYIIRINNIKDDYMYCIKCNCKIPKGRLKILPNAKECVKCSSEDLNMVRSVITGKTTYSEWEVIKNKDTKEQLKRLEGKGRRGFGSMLYRGSRQEPSHKIEKTGDKLEKVIEDAMIWIDVDRSRTISIIDKAVTDDTISERQRRQAMDIIEVFSPSPKKPEVKVKQDIIDPDIINAFKYWK
jgi:hypothetical protein